MEAEPMARRLAMALVTAAMLAATYAVTERVFAFYVECGWWTWPFCGF